MAKDKSERGSGSEKPDVYPVFIYHAKWFQKDRVKELLYALERSGMRYEGDSKALWHWSSHRRVFNFSGQDAEKVVNRLNGIYPAEKIIKF